MLHSTKRSKSTTYVIYTSTHIYGDYNSVKIFWLYHMLTAFETKKKHLNWPQIFFGQQAPSSITSSTYSPSLSHKGVGTEWQSGSTETTEPFSIHLYRQQPRTEPFQTSPGARGLPSLSVHTENVPSKNTLRISIYWNPIIQSYKGAVCCFWWHLLATLQITPCLIYLFF